MKQEVKSKRVALDAFVDVTGIDYALIKQPSPSVIIPREVIGFIVEDEYGEKIVVDIGDSLPFFQNYISK